MNARQKAKKYKQAFDRLKEFNNIHKVDCFSYKHLEEVRIASMISYYPHGKRMNEEMLMRVHTMRLAEEFEKRVPMIMQCEENEVGNMAQIRFWIERK